MNDAYADLDTPYSVRPPRRKWLYFWAGFVLLVLVVVGIYVYVNYATERELQTALAETDQLDPRWRLPDLLAARPVIPDERNSAAVVMAAKKQLPNKWPSWSYSDLPDGGANPQALQPTLRESFEQLEPQARLSDVQVTALRSEMKRAEQAVAEARKLADLPEGRFPITYAPNWVGTLLPNIQDAREIAALLANDALLRAQDGDLDGALASCRGIVNTGRSIGDEPFTIAQLVRLACRAVALSSVQRMLAQGEPSEEALRQFQQVLEQEEAEPLLLIAVRGERAGIDQLMDNVQAGTVVLSLPLRVPLYVKTQRAALLRHMNQAVEIAKLPLAEQQAQYQELERSLKDGPTYVRLLAPATAKVAEAYLRSQAQMRCGIVLVAAERYRRARGNWPEGLEALKTAGYLKEVLTDPYDGQPLRWRRMIDGRIVYSIGPDRRDNDGNLDPQRIGAPGTDLGYRLWDVAKRAGR